LILLLSYKRIDAHIISLYKIVENNQCLIELKKWSGMSTKFNHIDHINLIDESDFYLISASNQSDNADWLLSAFIELINLLIELTSASIYMYLVPAIFDLQFSNNKKKKPKNKTSSIIWLFLIWRFFKKYCPLGNT
jgi:hypothetical protein